MVRVRGGRESGRAEARHVPRGRGSLKVRRENLGATSGADGRDEERGTSDGDGFCCFPSWCSLLQQTFSFPKLFQRRGANF